MSKLFDFSQTNVVIAGANGLIGKATAQTLYDSGANVFNLDVTFSNDVPGQQNIVDITSQDSLQKFFADLKSETNNWSFVQAAYPRTANWGKLNLLDCSVEDFQKNVDLQLGSSFLFLQAALKFLLNQKSGGNLITLSSIYGVVGPDNRIYGDTGMQTPVPYPAIKSGLTQLTKFIATTHGKDGIRANTVTPGGVKDQQPNSFIEKYCERTPLNRMAIPEDIAGAIAFLCSPAANYITGQNIIVDGGWTAW